MTGAVGFIAATASTPSMGVTANPEAVFGSYRGASTSAVDITTSSTLASVAGGVPPYSYAWALYSASAYTWTIGSDSAATTTFTAQSVGPGASAEAQFIIVVTDAAGVTSYALVSAISTNLSTG